MEEIELSEKDKWVMEKMAALKGKPLSYVAKAYIDLRKGLDALTAEKSKFEALKDALDKGLLPKLMEEAKLESIKLKEGGTLRLQPDFYVSVPAEKKEGVFKWFRKHKMKSMITETINSSTLAAFVRNSMKEGKPLPTAEGLKVTPYTKTVYTTK